MKQTVSRQDNEKVEDTQPNLLKCFFLDWLILAVHGVKMLSVGEIYLGLLLSHQTVLNEQKDLS